MEELPSGPLDEERSKRLYAGFGITVTRELVVKAGRRQRRLRANLAGM